MWLTISFLHHNHHFYTSEKSCKMERKSTFQIHYHFCYADDSDVLSLFWNEAVRYVIFLYTLCVQQHKTALFMIFWIAKKEKCLHKHKNSIIFSRVQWNSFFLQWNFFAEFCKFTPLNFHFGNHSCFIFLREIYMLSR